MVPDGRYQVVVDTASPSLPRDSFNTPYVPTTATNVLMTIAGGSSSPSTANFGFAPALGLTKTKSVSGPVYESRLVMYSLNSLSWE